jgi:hypothetical protein
VRFSVALLALLFATSAGAEPLVFDNGRLFIPASVNGRSTEALLDSAAEATLVDPAFAATAKLPEGEPVTIRGSGGSASAKVVEGAEVNALGLTIHPDALVVTDLTDISRRLAKRQVSMILGREIFDSGRLRVDISGRTVEVVPATAKAAGMRLPLTRHAGVEAIPVKANDVPAQAEFDLGNGSGVLISRALVKRLHLKITGKRSGGGIGGAVDRDLVHIPRLQVAGVTYRNVEAAVDDLPNANDLNIGTSILKDFVITTDFAKRAVWLAPVGSGRGGL